MADGRASGVVGRDVLADESFEINARKVVVAAGVWLDSVYNPPRAAGAPPRSPRRHLLSISDLTRFDIERILDLIAGGSSTEQALREVLHSDYNDLMQSTAEYLRKTYGQ